MTSRQRDVTVSGWEWWKTKTREKNTDGSEGENPIEKD